MSEDEILDTALNPMNQLLTLGYDDHKGDQRVRSLGVPSNVTLIDLIAFARIIEAHHGIK